MRSGTQLAIYVPGAMHQRLKEFSLKYNIPITHLTLYALEETIERIETEKNINIFELKKEIKEKIHKYYKEIHNFNKEVIKE